MKLSQNPVKRNSKPVSLLKDSDFEIKTQSELRQKRKKGPSSTAFAERTAEIIKSCQPFLKAPTFNHGDDADSYFRKTLRNWDDLKFARTPRWITLNSVRSIESIKSERRVCHSAKTATYSVSSVAKSASVYSHKGAGDRRSDDKLKLRHAKGKKSPLLFRGSLPELVTNRSKKGLIRQKYSLEQPFEGEVVSFDIGREEEHRAREETVEEEIKFDSGEEDVIAVRTEAEENDVEKSEKTKEEADFQDEDLDLFFSPSSEGVLEREQLSLEEELYRNEQEAAKVIEVKQVEELQEEKEEEEGEFPNESITAKYYDHSETEEKQELGMAEDTTVEEIGIEDTVTDDLQTETIADDDLQEIENLVKQADQELDQVMDENPDLKGALDENVSNLCDTKKGTEGAQAAGFPCAGAGGGGGSFFQYDPTIDAAVLAELEDAERQAMETAKIIYELKQRVGELLCKTKMTEAEGKELEEKNCLLKEQMQLFEEKTKRIQQLIAQTNLFEKMTPLKPSTQHKRPEDMLPKVVICGLTENNMPKIIVCDDKDKKRRSKPPCSADAPSSPCGVVPKFAKRLSESYTMQEKLAAENAQLEGTRDQFVENLQRKLCSLEQELKLVCKENNALNQRLKGREAQEEPKEASPCGTGRGAKRMPCGKGKGPCPAEMESRLQEYVETTHALEKQLNDMESEVRHMQCELVEVQKERQHLEHHRRMICTPPCKPCPPPCPPPCGPQPRAPCGTIEQQLSQLKEQYCRLQDDFKGKLTEVASLRAENEKMKRSGGDIDEFKKAYEQKMKDLEREVRVLKMELEKSESMKQQMVEMEAQLNVAKQRFRDAQDELEELRALIQDQQTQMDDYRNKYLQAQQTVEEQRRQIDLMEIENNRITEQVNLEIQRVKNQFQEKLQELTPLPDILKATQIKLQEAQQMHLLAERNNEAISRELQQYKDRAAAMAADMEKVRSDQQLGADEQAVLEQKIRDLTTKVQELEEENDKIKMDMVRLEEAYDQAEKRVQEKLHEITQLVAQLDSVREESARQVARTKDRCETVRRSMQNQIADLERQLAQSRAQARQAQKDRDEIRQKMQAQITNLNENFEDAQMRIKNLQAHVNFLKNTYSTVYPDGGVAPMGGDGGIDACDCGQY
ncbi:myosin-2 isoform X2 [Agrilus planipennis]|uniref:Myosin-2 isoform X2 n=1 Tax=Agrilus planipennis TaxID=224129 RepID=A0A7F5RGQ1_AGRPL|nr:myosin-2 isoform X2 [Agrilus planipennis]